MTLRLTLTAVFVATAALPVVSALPAGAQALPTWTPPAFDEGALPETSIEAVGGGNVLLEVTVDADGAVTDETVLREAPPFTDAIRNAVRTWQFRPAEETIPPPSGSAAGTLTRPVAAQVLVAYVVRPPALFGPTLGSTPTDVAAPTEGVAYPSGIAVPLYPPTARDAGIALAEVSVDETGVITDASILRSAPGFDDAARQALKDWFFRPARVGGDRVTTHVYIVFAWRIPVT
jgi:TonB family protein